MSLGTWVLGLINGSIISLLAAGFVLVYKSNRFLNLAHAQLGALPAILVAKLVNDHGWNFWAALVTTVPIGLLTGAGVERFLVRPVRSRTKSPVRLLILTVGIAELLLALTFVTWLAPSQQSGKPYPQPFHSHVEIGGVVLTGMSVLTLVVVPLLLIGLTAFIGYSSLGRQIRAAANNADAARLCGISIDRVSVFTWGLAGGLSAISAILNGPTTPTFNAAAVGPNLLILTMGAAAFGAFVSLPWAVGGGLLLGLVYQIVSGETHNAGTSELVIFAMILAVILIRGNAIGRVFAVTGAAVPERPAIRIPPILRSDPLVRHYSRWLGLGALLVAVAFPRLPYFRTEGNRFLLVLVVVYAIIGISLTILIGWGGQVSLGHFALVGLGAFLAAKWAHHWPITTLVVVIGLIGAAVAALVGLPAVRVRGLTLVVTTVGFAVLAPEWLYLQRWVGGPTPFTTPVQRPKVGAGLGTANSAIFLYYLALILLVAFVLAASSLRRSNAGRIILAVRDNERASASFGIANATIKLSVLALSGFMAATAGIIWAFAWQRVTPEQFGPDVSTAILAVPVVGGLGSLAGALTASVMLYMPTLFLAPHLEKVFGSFGQNIGFLLLLGGLGVVGTMRQFPNGIAGQAQEKWQAYLDRRAARVALEVPSANVDQPLVVANASIRFGGIRALDGVDIHVGPSEIVGLIGPNGAGKTTLMNVISGLLSPQDGSIQIFGHEVVDFAPDVRAAYGMARSFQDASLFSGLTVTETIQVALSNRSKTGVLAALAGAPWVRAFDRESLRRAEEIIASFGLEAWAETMTSELSTGSRRICDLAAQVAAGPKLLLLDEPTAGVAQREAEAFGPLLRRIREQLDCSVLIIEHDMPLLMGLCDRVYAMEAGRVIAEGTPQEIRNDPSVVASYLGGNTAAISRSGRTSGPPERTPARRTATVDKAARRGAETVASVEPPPRRRTTAGRPRGTK